MSDSSPQQEIGGANEGGGRPGQLRYPLRGRAIDRWLLAGPLAAPLVDTTSLNGMELDASTSPNQEQLSFILHKAREGRSFLPIARAASEGASGAGDPPVFGGWRLDSTGTPAEREAFSIAEDKLTWRAHRCMEDHLIDLGAYYATWHYVQAWAFCELVCAGEEQVEFVFDLFGAAEVWLNDQQIMQHEMSRLPGTVSLSGPTPGWTQPRSGAA